MKLFSKPAITSLIIAGLLFLSFSFIQFLAYTNPFHHFKNDEYYLLKIGFPLTYYQQFWVSGNSFPNTNWFGYELIIDILFFVFASIISYKLLN
jgi:hypothetical protein